MTYYTNSLNDDIANIIVAGGIGVLRTDTLYGIVASAGNNAAVERVYTVKRRTPTKSPIVLIGSIEQLFDDHSPVTIARLKSMWPGKHSIILPSEQAPSWLTRGNESIAYRLPNDEQLRQFLLKTGPLIAPSANVEGEEPAHTAKQAEEYFGDQVDFYVDGGEVTDPNPSELHRLHGDGFERLR